MPDRRTAPLLIALVALTASLTVSCSGSPQPTATAEPTGQSASGAQGDLNGAHVDVVGLWSGPELDSFMTVKAAWEAETGGVVDWEGSQNLSDDLNSRIKAGNPPDIAVLSNPGLMTQLAKDGSLVPLDSFMDMNQVGTDYAKAWTDLGSYDGSLYAIFYKVSNKATVWYNPKAFTAAGYSVPATWDDMIGLADHMVADGHTPFSVVSPGGPASGWALTDWVAEIVLNGCGPEVYDSWVAGETPWTDACIKRSFEKFLQIVQTPGYVLGGSAGILGTTDSAGTYPLYTDPPTAYMYYLASFAQAFIAQKYPSLTPAEDYDVFPFPTIGQENAVAVTVGADIVVMTHDTPAARWFMTYLAGAKAQEAWIALGGFTSVNRRVSLDSYADPVARKIAQELADATVARFGAGDSMPSSVQRAWWTAMDALVKDPSTLDATLSSMTAAGQGAR